MNKEEVEVRVSINTGQKYYGVYVLFYTSPTVYYTITLSVPVDALELNHGEYMKVKTNKNPNCVCLLKKYQNEKLEILFARNVWYWVYDYLGEYVI